MGCSEKASKSLQVPLNGIEAVVVLTDFDNSEAALYRVRDCPIRIDRACLFLGL